MKIKCLEIFWIYSMRLCCRESSATSPSKEEMLNLVDTVVLVYHVSAISFVCSGSVSWSL